MQTATRPNLPFSLSGPNFLLRLEGLVLFLAAVALYRTQGGEWLMFALLLFVPDIGMLGYLANLRVGALVYNLVHFMAVPAALLLIGLSAQSPLTIQIAAIWLAHINMDRVVGYGLKYTTAFKDTHLQRA
jgi:hypothetical protein